MTAKNKNKKKIQTEKDPRQEKCEAGGQNRSKNLANTRLDLRNAANSLQIEGNGVLPGDPYHWGVRNTEHETIYIYIYGYVFTYIYIYMSVYMYILLHVLYVLYVYRILYT